MLTRHSIALVLALVALPAWAVEVSLGGSIGGKAILVIDGKTRTVAVGQATPEGVKLLSLAGEVATVEVDEARRTLRMGQHMGQHMGQGQDGGKAKTVLQADVGGHFITLGSINGIATRMMVDTGATAVSMSSAEARRLGIDYTKGQRGMTATANGVVPVFNVTLNSVKVGDIQHYQVAGTVIEGNSPAIVLLGMSFLSRLQMQREGTSMTLIKAY
jgi:aspartyl protease family protein